MGDLDDQDSRNGLERKLGDRSYGSNKRILVSSQAGIFLEAEDGSISEDGFIKNLEEVDPDQNNKNHFVGLSTDSPVLWQSIVSKNQPTETGTALTWMIGVSRLLL